MMLLIENLIKWTSTEGGEWTEAVSENWLRKKETEWINLVGEKKWKALPFILQWFLMNAAGMLDLGFPVNIKKALKMEPY